MIPDPHRLASLGTFPKYDNERAVGMNYFLIRIWGRQGGGRGRDKIRADELV
jgi:hypothetical protein